MLGQVRVTPSGKVVVEGDRGTVEMDGRSNLGGAIVTAVSSYAHTPSPQPLSLNLQSTRAAELAHGVDMAGAIATVGPCLVHAASDAPGLRRRPLRAARPLCRCIPVTSERGC